MIPVAALASVLYIRTKRVFVGTFMTLIVVVFLLVFPVGYLATGGSAGVMPYYFLAAVALTALMVQGARFYIAIALELVLYGGCMLFSITHPKILVQLPEHAAVELSQPVGLICVAIVISVTVYSVSRLHLRVALELDRSNNLLKLSDQNKDAFFAMLSHELKTPVTVMSTHAQEAAQILANTDQPSPELELAHRDMDIIVRQGEVLSQMVTQLLDVTRINEGRLAFDRRPISLASVVQEAMADMAPLTAENGNVLRLKAGGAQPTVIGDPKRLNRALTNLISNASRHTTKGVITLAVSKEPGFARVTVEDTGEGISEAHLREIMSSSARAARRTPWPAPSRSGRASLPDAALDGSTPGEPPIELPTAAGSKHGGLGLGLRIVRYTIARHGGHFSLSSELGQGTTATFTVPLAPTT
jgi:signal transduction histidine kinase